MCLSIFNAGAVDHSTTENTDSSESKTSNNKKKNVLKGNLKATLYF